MNGRQDYVLHMSPSASSHSHREEHESPFIVEPGELPVEPDQGEVPATGIPSDGEFERTVNLPD